MSDLGLLDKTYCDFVKKNANELDYIPNFERDYDFTYFGYKTLEKSYLNKKIDALHQYADFFYAKWIKGLNKN